VNRQSANLLLLLLAGAAWGMGFVAQATAMRDIGPFLFIALRFLVAALSFVQFVCTAVLAVAVALAIEPIDVAAIVRALPSVLYAGVFASGFAFTLQAVAQRHTTASQAAIFLSSEAPFAALFAFVFLGERIGLLGLGGCAMILAAMLLVELWPARAARQSANAIR